MCYDAVVFDLFGTLVPQFTNQMYREMLDDMARVLGVDADSFATAWFRDGGEGDARICGLVRFDDDVISACCTLGCTPDEQGARSAWNAYSEYVRRSLIPRDDAIQVLSQLKSEGYKIALVSDCSWEMPYLWPETPFVPWFDAVVFSCEQGTRKPDPRMYLLAADGLGVSPERCLYIGDGGCIELNGASAVGMHPVLMCAPEDREIVMKRTEPDGWHGHAISGLSEALTLLGVESGPAGKG